MKKLTVLAVPLLLLWSAAGAQAGVIQIAAFTGIDHIAWSQLPLGSQGTNSAVVTTNLGATATVTGNGDDLIAFEEGNFFFGDFGLGEFGIVVRGDDGDVLTIEGEVLTIDFSSPVNAVGAQIEPDLNGIFTAELRLFDAGNVLIGGPFIVTSSMEGNSDDSSPFLGALSDSANITRAVFAIIAHDGVPVGGHPGVGINQLELGVAVPEPVSLSLLGLGLAGYAIRRRRTVR